MENNIIILFTGKLAILRCVQASSEGLAGPDSLPLVSTILSSATNYPPSLLQHKETTYPYSHLQTMVSNKLHMHVFSQRVEGRNMCRHKENMQQTQQQHRKAESEATTSWFEMSVLTTLLKISSISLFDAKQKRQEWTFVFFGQFIYLFQLDNTCEVHFPYDRIFKALCANQIECFFFHISNVLFLCKSL